MNGHPVEYETAIIVFVGNMNPTIFHPAWFAKEGLIRESEAESSEIKIVHPDITAFSLDWMNIEVTRNKFIINTDQNAYFDVLRDLTVGVFSLLSHTPISAMGINYECHIRLGLKEDVYDFFNLISPKEKWKEVFNKPTLKKLMIKETQRPDKFKGEINITIEPSVKIKNKGIFISVNDHYDLEESNKTEKLIPSLLKKQWEPSLNNSKNYVDKVKKIK